MKVKSRKLKSNKGITLFIAVIVMSILLFISFAVVNVSLKSTIFAFSGRNSQFAFYAADTGLECALYWDSKFDAFATSTSETIFCAGNGIAGTGQPLYGTTTLGRIGGGGDANPTSIFSFLMNPPTVSSSCAVVTVTKYYNDVDGDGSLDLVTYIKSRGYNTCDVSNPRRVERGIEVRY
jgi:Tfp pilus assembly protein PilX